MALSGDFRKAFSLVIDFEMYKAYRNLHLLGDKGRQGNFRIIQNVRNTLPSFFLCFSQL